MPTLLVIDDQQGVRLTLNYLFSTAGFTVVLAENSTSALALYNPLVVDAALIDIFMPGMNGLDLCRELCARAQQAGRDLPVFLMSGAPTSEHRRRAAEFGALGVLAKPFDVEAFIQDLKTRRDNNPAMPRV
ncbi:MAG: response regulator [Opitutaceae bacterium]|nr:response regulator [Opitutaceae bacterium]